jgi:hypothetical protein
MKSFKNYTTKYERIDELNVEKYLKRNKLMSDKEKAIIINFFSNRKTSFDKWQNIENLTFDDFKPYMEFKNFSDDVVMRMVKKRGLKALTKNVDYIDVSNMFDYWKAYIPLNFNASKAIASKYINRCKGNWCTAINKGTWEEYRKLKFVIIYLIDPHNNDKKVVAYLPNTAYPIQVFDASNNKHAGGYPDFELEHEDIDDIIRKNGKKMVKMVYGNTNHSTYIPDLNGEHFL